MREGWGGVIRDGRYLRTGLRVTIEDIRADLVSSPGVVDRLAQIGRDAAPLRDPNVLAVYDLVDDGTGRYRLVAEWSEAPTLAQRLRHGEVSAEQGVAIVDDVLAGLVALHGAGVFHGHVGPDTVVVEAGGRARLAELAVCAAAAPSGAGPATDVRDAASLGLHLLRNAGGRLDALRRVLDGAVAAGSGDAARLREDVAAAAVAALGAGWRDRVAAPLARRGSRRRPRVRIVALLALAAVGAGVAAGLLFIGNHSGGPTSPGALVIGTDASLSVNPAKGGCNTTFVFVGRGSLSGAGRLVYRWEQSDGAVTSDTSLPIGPAEGAFQLTQAWRLQGSQTVNGSMTLHIVKPIDRRIAQTFRYVCP
jgi:hypothetical protein